MPDQTCRVIVTGSREFPSEDAVWEALAMLCAERLPNGGTITVVHGDCPRGADHYARTWCALPTESGYDLTVVEERHPADWATHSRAAGPIRNQHMVDLGADVVLAFPYGAAKGTWHCVDAARRAGIPVEVLDSVSPRFPLSLNTPRNGATNA